MKLQLYGGCAAWCTASYHKRCSAHLPIEIYYNGTKARKAALIPDICRWKPSYPSISKDLPSAS
jgi:hypothetical protein